ncbi:unnamed protein product [Lactuca virosa]|uniref:Uncharacterized protein n=1 Tax=Lactuca virosa TaxID=75947 RepID=A0AAU9NPM8_9ASTR|nr:unnamed protein product [Lactuca virosa]
MIKRLSTLIRESSISLLKFLSALLPLLPLSWRRTNLETDKDGDEELETTYHTLPFCSV